MVESNTSIIASKNTKLDIDLASLYYLHYSNSLSVSLVSQPLIGDNYPTWCRATIISFKAKNILRFLNGSITKPVANSSFFPLLKSMQ